MRNTILAVQMVVAAAAVAYLLMYFGKVGPFTPSLSQQGMVMQSSDGGMTWKPYGTIVDRSPDGRSFTLVPSSSQKP